MWGTKMRPSSRDASYLKHLGYGKFIDPVPSLYDMSSGDTISNCH